MEKQIASLFNEYKTGDHFSGAGLVKRGDTVIFSGAYGFAHRGFQIPNTTDTMFDTASVTKLFTAVAVLQLVDRGLLRLDDKITELIDLRGTKFPGDITLTHLLTHTSGIADDADEEAGEVYEDLFIDKPNYSIRRCADFLPQFAYKEPLFKAGTDVRYNNCAFVLLGLAIEKVTHQSYQDYVTTEIFETCGMKHSAFYAKDDADAKIAEGYYYDGTDCDGNPVWRKNIYSYPPVGTADGGAYTSVGDLDIFIRALKNGILLSKALSEEIFKPQTGLEKFMNGAKSSTASVVILITIPAAGWSGCIRKAKTPALPRWRPIIPASIRRASYWVTKPATSGSCTGRWSRSFSAEIRLPPSTPQTTHRSVRRARWGQVRSDNRFFRR